VIEIPSENYDEYGDIHKTLQHILDTIVANYTLAGIDLPERRFTAIGDVASVANDCEQVTVNFIQAYLGQPGQPDVLPFGCPSTMSGDFVAQVVRCVPGAGATGRGIPKPPSVEAIEASTLVQAVDAQILLQSAFDLSSIRGKSATVTPSGSDGKFQSVMLNLSISLFRS
jgi:hypothetical protein